MADQFCIAKHYGNHRNLFYQYRGHLSGIYHSGGDQCGQCADNGNPGDSGDCDAVWAVVVQNIIKVFRFLLYFKKPDRVYSKNRDTYAFSTAKAGYKFPDEEFI